MKELVEPKQNKEILFGVSAVLAAVSFTVSVLLLLVSSARAFVIFGLLSPMAIALQFSMAASLSEAWPPSFPAELVGQWELTRDSRSNDVAAYHAMMFNFDPKGYYLNRSPREPRTDAATS